MSASLLLGFSCIVSHRPSPVRVSLVKNVDLLCQNSLDILGIVQQCPNLDRLDELDGLFPLAHAERLGRLDDVVPGILRRAHECLLVGLVEETLELFARNAALLLFRLGGSEERDLDEHARGQVGRFEQLNVEVHVERQQAALLNQLLLGRNGVAVPLDGLGQQLFLPLRRKHVGEDRLAFGNVAETERRETELHDGAVVEDLGRHVGLRDGILQVRHQEQVARLVIPSASGVVENVAQDRTRAQEGRVRVVNGHAQQADQGRGREGRVERRDARRQALHAGSGKSLEVLNDIVGLGVQVLDAAHDGPHDIVGPAFTLKQGLGLGDERVERCFLAKTSNVLGALFVGIRVLQRLGKL